MIDNIELKLSGLEPVSRKELFELVNSWGRKYQFSTNDDIEINNCEPSECYNLSNLDVSKIIDLSYIFKYSPYNGDLSNWNVSNCINIEKMFSYSDFNNNSLKNWNTSNILDMEYLFYKSKFNGDISNWDISKVKVFESTFDSCPFDGDISKWQFQKEKITCFEMFMDNNNFIDKYNDGNKISNYTKGFLFWFEENKAKIRDINTSKKEIFDFFSFDNDLELKD